MSGSYPVARGPRPAVRRRAWPVSSRRRKPPPLTPHRAFRVGRGRGRSRLWRRGQAVRGVREFAWLAPACHTEGATDARGTPRVRASLSAQPWCSCAMSSAPSLCLSVAKLDDCASCVSSRWDGARPCCCSNRVARARRSAVIRFAPGGDQAHHLPADALDLEAVPVVAGGPLQPEPLGEGFLQVLRDDRGDSADVPVVAKGVRDATSRRARFARRGRSGSGRGAACRRRGWAPEAASAVGAV